MRAQLGAGEVTLRRLRAQDAPVLHRVVQESLTHLEPWMPWVADGYPPEQASAWVASTITAWEDGTEFNYGIFVSGRLAGAASLMARIGPNGLELGYWLHPDHVGHGVATRAASLLVTEAFRSGARRVEIVTDVANARSAAIPKRLGFTIVDRRPPRERITSGEDGLDVVWRLTPDRGRSGEAQGSS